MEECAGLCCFYRNSNFEFPLISIRKQFVVCFIFQRGIIAIARLIFVYSFTLTLVGMMIVKNWKWRRQKTNVFLNALWWCDANSKRGEYLIIINDKNHNQNSIKLLIIFNSFFSFRCDTDAHTHPRDGARAASREGTAEQANIHWNLCRNKRKELLNWTAVKVPWEWLLLRKYLKWNSDVRFFYRAYSIASA